MAKTQVDKILDTDFSKLPSARDLYTEFLRETEIEKYKEEKYVIAELMKGKTKKSIVHELSLMHPPGVFNVTDLNGFIERNKELTSKLEREKKALSRRHLDAKVKIEEELAELAMYTKTLIKKYDEQGDNASTINAIKTLSDLIMRFGKMAGYLDAPSNNSEKTNIIQIISENKSDVASKLVEANFSMYNKKNAKNLSEPEGPKNQTSNS